MAEKTYRFRLMIHDEIAYESVIEKSNPQEALEWGFYYMPNTWYKRKGRDRCAPIHAEICIQTDDGRLKNWSFYDNDYLVDASRIPGFDADDLRHLLAGQQLIWVSDDAPGMLFKSYHDAQGYFRNTGGSARVKHIWVDGWYGEQWSWEAKGVKGYELSNKWRARTP